MSERRNIPDSLMQWEGDDIALQLGPSRHDWLHLTPADVRALFVMLAQGPQARGKGACECSSGEPWGDVPLGTPRWGDDWNGDMRVNPDCPWHGNASPTDSNPSSPETPS